MDTTGKGRAVEQGSPANLEVWRSCGETSTVAALSIGIATPAVLARYALRFEERCNRYARAWHLCVKVDERCCSEFWAAELRRQERFHKEHPDLSAVNAEMLWCQAIQESTDNVGFWLQGFQEPAMLYAQVWADIEQPRALRDQDRQGWSGKG